MHDYFRHVQTNSISTEEVLDLAIQISENKAALDSIVDAQTSRLGEIKYYLGEFHCTNPNNPHTVSVVSGLSLDSFAVSLNGVDNGLGEGGPAIEAVTLYSLTLSTSSHVAIGLPAHSVTSLVVY